MKADPAEKLRDFFVKGKPRLYKKGEVILRGDEIPNGIFFLNKGYVKNYSFSEKGTEFTFIISRKGDFFPLAWTFVKTRKPYFFEAITPCVIYRQSRDDFLAFLLTNPDVLFYITGRITNRVDGLLERMEHMVFGNAYERVCSILYILSERFGEKKINSEIVILLPLTHKDIANLLGMARETVSVEIAKLKNEKILKTAGKYFYIRSLKKLREKAMIS